MITNEQIQDVLHLLHEGLSQRNAADTAGVSRKTVKRIAAGKLSPRPRSGTVEFLNVHPYRCPSCKAMITTNPCVRYTVLETKD